MIGFKIKIKRWLMLHNFKNIHRKKHVSGFTIVELLIVIVIIGILAAITIVSYTGITARANSASLQSDLANASKKLAMYFAEYSTYPTSINTSTGCPIAPSANDNYCIKIKSDITATYGSTSSSTYVLTYSNNTLTYKITPTQPPTASVSGSDWVAVGNQLWAKANLNTGTMIAGATVQTNNGGTNIIEKYCYNDTESNCTTYGALYQWDEAMKYSNTEGSQGICPTGSHIPSDNDWKILEMQLGMAQATVDTTDWRGNDEGTKLKSGGSSGMSIPLSGGLYGGVFNYSSSTAIIWSSSESDTTAWRRVLDLGHTNASRTTAAKTIGYSVRCLGN